MLAAAVQLNSTSDKERNIHLALDQVRVAAHNGAQIVVLPEYTDYLGPVAGARDIAEPIPGATTRAFGALAAELGIVLVAGSIWERSEEESSTFHNTVTAFDGSGQLVATYRKLHTFDVELDSLKVAKESRLVTGGAKVVDVCVQGVHIGLATCYDLRFPEVMRLHALSGCTVLVIPAAFRAETGRDHWEVLIRARAIENQCYVIAADQVGVDGRGVRSFGRSMIVDPWGVVLSCAPDHPTIVYATIDAARQAQLRRDMPVLGQRREDVYLLADRSAEGKAG